MNHIHECFICNSEKYSILKITQWDCFTNAKTVVYLCTSFYVTVVTIQSTYSKKVRHYLLMNLQAIGGGEKERERPTEDFQI